MATNASGRSRDIVIWALRIVLGAAFAYIGTTKLTGTGNTVEWFAAIGWGQWFRYVTGSIDLVGAVLLFVPPWTSYGATAVACSVGLGTIISVTVLHGNPTWGGPVMVVVPLVLTVLAIALARLTSPAASG